MEVNGNFSYTDYDVMDRSCNTFTAALADRLGVAEKYPPAIQRYLTIQSSHVRFCKNLQCKYLD
jgi:hypothetical protein